MEAIEKRMAPLKEAIKQSESAKTHTKAETQVSIRVRHQYDSLVWILSVLEKE